MRFVHSLWTKPMLRNARDIRSRQQIITTLFCNATSVAYLKKLGQTIILYGDKYAQHLLSYLPYDDVNTLYIPDNAPEGLWAAGKFYALEEMELQDIHIDGDVFIKTQELVNRIKYGIENNDLIIQSIEDKQHTANYYYEYCRQLTKEHNITFLYEANAKHTEAYNCGTVGFNSHILKYKYLNNYFHCYGQIRDNEKAQQWIKQANCWPDLLFEQQNLLQLSEGFKVFNLLGTGKEAYKNAIKYGYQHILGKTKWEVLSDIKTQLKNLDNNIYETTEKQVTKVLQELDNE